MGRLRNSTEIDAAIFSVVTELRMGYTPNSRTRKTMMRLRIAMNSKDFQTHHFRDLIIPLAKKSSFTAHPKPHLYYSLNLVEDALKHPNCPADVLKKVCTDKDITSSQYRKAAIGNANCPEEASVYAALANTKEQWTFHIASSCFKGSPLGMPR